MIFLTGVPGFLGTRLLGRLAQTHPGARFGLLVQPKFRAKAEGAVRRLGIEERAELFEGDITAPGLGLGREEREHLTGAVERAYHLAAVYDLTIPEAVGRRVNVDGTRHVLDFLECCARLEIFAYVSTAYVAGRRTGEIREDELRHRAGFKNHYERTKYEAEVCVQERRLRVPTVIYRPAIVVGDSRTGATDKFDGPYFLLNALRRLPPYTLMTRVGAGDKPVNVVPVDFVTEAMATLTEPRRAGAVFHLTDPDPLTTREMLSLFLRLLDKEAVFVPVPPMLARAAVQTPLGLLLGLTPQLVDYFDFPAYYDNRRAAEALAEEGVRCPRLPEYAPQMVDYLRQHADEPDARAEAMY
ncbi:MAG: 3-beta hydroxysteroid dehydrogenase [Bacteroidetes bacterium SW_4_67_19]|jgi:thioester reductase-like protein|nr:MAG: 3-beta hydroxysteroid dehydrogenase [Bacteroidetes bacterium SW_4_67_19]